MVASASGKEAQTTAVPLCPHITTDPTTETTTETETMAPLRPITDARWGPDQVTMKIH